MATKLYFRTSNSDWQTGNQDTNLRGSAYLWNNYVLSTAAGSSATNITTNTVAGPIAGVEVAAAASIARVWITPPLNADVTISGSITWNVWCRELDTSSNVSLNGRIEVVDGATGTITLIDQTARTTEMAASGTTNSVVNFSETPGAGVACKRGDRLRVRIYGDDSNANMATAKSFTVGIDGPTAAVTGDSWVQVNENLTFVSEPAGTTIYPTNTASAVSTASNDLEAWTSRGAGVQTATVNSAAGWTSPIQVTDTAGGTVVDWFTAPLTAFTLGGAVRVNARTKRASGSAAMTTRCEIARVAGDGTSPSVWGATTDIFQGGASETAKSFLVGGDDLAITDGQRLRIRFYIDDAQDEAMLASATWSLYYAGTSGGASGDTYLTFTQTLTEYTASVTVTPTTAALVATLFAPTVTVSDHQLVTPTTAALTSATFAPTVTVLAPEIVTPTTAALSLATFAPTVTATDAQLLIPTTKTLSTTTFAPTVTASDVQLITPSTATLTSALFAPAITTAAATYPQLVVSHAATAYYRMGEPSGSVIDSIGGPSGTANGTVTRDVTGSLSSAYDDGAIDFNGSTGYIAVTSATGNNPADTFSVEAWIRPDAISGDHSFVYKGTTNRWGFSVRATVSNKLSFWSNGNLQVTSTTQLVVGTTYHVVFTKSGSTRKIYVNGSDVSDLSQPGTTNFTNLTNTDDLNIGRRNNGTEYWNGVIDELAIYAATALSAAQVLAHYETGISGPQTVTPTTATLVATKFAPTITTSDHQSVIPTTKTVVLATFAPTVTASDFQLVTPTTKALTLATFEPVVTATAHQQVTPSTTALILQAFAPTVTATDQQSVTPTTKALTLATFAPTVLTPQTVTPTMKTLALTTFAPTITNPDPQLVTPTTKSLTITKYAPSVGVSDAASIVIPNAALSLTTYAPTVIQPDPQLVTPTTPALELHTFEPVVTATAHQAVTPTTAAVVTTRHIPTVAATANQSAIPTTKALTLTAYAPQVTVNNIVVTVTIGLTLTTFAPSVTAGTNTYAFPDPASLTLTGYAPFIDLSAFKLVTPATAVLVLTTYPPTAEQHSITPLPTPIYGFAIVATGPGAGVEGGNGGATVTPSGRGSSTVSTSGPSAKVTIR